MSTMSVEAILTDSLSCTIRDWFEPRLAHQFLDIVNIPGAKKAIPHKWVDEVQIDDLLEIDDLGGAEGKESTWSQDDARQRLQSAFARLGIQDVAKTNVDKMGSNELMREKNKVKQELKRYDAEFQKQFSRLPTHTEKESMRPLYVYYRKLKTLMSQMEQNKHDGDRRGMQQSSLETIPEPDEPLTAQSRQKRVQSVGEQILDLESRIENLTAEKALVRAKLQTFQERFVTENSRKIRFHKDILPIEREYRTYKNLKEDIMKVEGQLRALRGGAEPAPEPE